MREMLGDRGWPAARLSLMRWRLRARRMAMAPATLRLTLHAPGSPRRCRRGAPESPRGGARFPPALRSVLNHHGKQKLQQKTFPMGP